MGNRECAGTPYVVLTVAAGCPACAPLIAALDRGSPGLPVRVVAAGEESAVRALLQAAGARLEAAVTDEPWVWRTLGLSRYPSAILVGASGRIECMVSATHRVAQLMKAVAPSRVARRRDGSADAD